MITDYQIPVPFLFNPLKHHLGYIKEYIELKADESDIDIINLNKELQHLGRSVMDVYTGSLSIREIYLEVEEFLRNLNIFKKEPFSLWTGMDKTNFKTVSLSDRSQWILKFHDNKQRFVHLFPARNSLHSFRIKSNTLKSALLYSILIGKDFITVEDLNQSRIRVGLSPIKDTTDTIAIMEMIETLRD